MPSRSRLEIDSKGERLLGKIERMRSAGPGDGVDALLHELQVYQEELRVQNAQLITTQHELEASRDRYIGLYDFAPIGYLTLDLNGMISEINLTGARLLGKERGKIIGAPFVQLVVADGRRDFLEFLRQVRDGLGQSVELTLRTTQGDVIVQMVATPPVADTGTPLTFLVAMMDVTEQRRLENNLRADQEAVEHADREREIAKASSDAKDRFFATLSHELRTPLNPVLAAVTDPRIAAQASPDLQRILEMIRRNVELEVRLIDDLLDVTRIARNRLSIQERPVDLHMAIRDVTEMLDEQSRTHRHTITTRFDARLSQVLGDPTRLRQVLWNLLSNAIKFTDNGGTITIATENRTADRVDVTITDTGAGLDEETARQLFVDTEQRMRRPLPAAAGLGLGLSICRSILEAHHGTISASSAGLGQGSSFVFSLPTIEPPETDRSAPAVDAAAPAPEGGLRILLVEDHEDSARMLSCLLALHGFQVDVASTVKAAREKAHQLRYDLLISDLRLPDGSGLDLMRELRREGPVRGIAVSGFGTPEDERRSAQAGYAAHLTKPVDIPTLLETINRVSAR